MSESKPRLLVTRFMPPQVQERIDRDYDALGNAADDLWSPETVAEKAEGRSALLICSSEKMTAANLKLLPDSIKAIATFSVGHDHIDLGAAKERGIAVSNTPDVLTDATADIAMLCLLGAARRAGEAERMLRAGQWDKWSSLLLCGVHVSGKRIGILGMGRIGQAVADRARGFGMTVHYSNRRQLPPELEKGAIYHQDPDDMLPHCDFLSLNAPASPETYHFVDQRRIGLLPEGAVVVNTARGTLVDDEALIAALKSGRLAAAGLDVFEGEPKFNKGYLDLDNAFLMPHIGSATVETRTAMGMKCLENLDAFFGGREMPDRIA